MAFIALVGCCQAVPQSWITPGWWDGTQHVGWFLHPLRRQMRLLRLYIPVMCIRVFVICLVSPWGMLLGDGMG